MAVNLLDECKKYLPKFYNNGEWNDCPVLKYNGHYVEAETVGFMANLFHFLVESSFLNQYAKYWLLSNMPSVRKAFMVYSEEVDEVEMVNLATVQSSIHYSKTRLHKYFSPRLLSSILAYPELHLKSAKETLDSLVRQYCDDIEYKEATALTIPKEFINREIDVELFNKLLETLKRYSKENIKKVSSLETSELTEEMVGYYNFLISSKNLKAEDKNRLNDIRKALGLGELK